MPSIPRSSRPPANRSAHMLERLHLQVAGHCRSSPTSPASSTRPGPKSGPQMLDILAQQVASPVQFVKGLRTLYEAGARVFVEVGPKKALQGFAEDVLGEPQRCPRAVHQPSQVRRYRQLQPGAVRPVRGRTGTESRQRPSRYGGNGAAPVPDTSGTSYRMARIPAIQAQHLLRPLPT